MTKKRMQPAPAFLLRLETAFLQHGYSQLSMIGLGEACNLTARSLYNYFRNKEEAFRAVVFFRNDLALTTGFAAAREQWANGGTALDIIATIMNIRFGDTRRLANASPHLTELAAETFKRCNDIITSVALYFEAELAKLIVELQDAGLLRLRPDFTPEQIAQALSNGARGVNQRLPPVPPEALGGRYREMCRFVLYGCAEMPKVIDVPGRKHLVEKPEGGRH